MTRLAKGLLALYRHLNPLDGPDGIISFSKLVTLAVVYKWVLLDTGPLGWEKGTTLLFAGFGLRGLSMIRNRFSINSSLSTSLTGNLSDIWKRRDLDEGIERTP